jgi:ketosteroid isomerase-like protein
MEHNLALVSAYFEAVAQGNFPKVAELLSQDVIWHQPGQGVQSGTYEGQKKVFQHLGNLMKWSDGSFSIDQIDYLSANGNLIAASIHFKAEKKSKSISMKGIDLLKVENNMITEVWLFSEHIEQEDQFWNLAAEN